MSETAKVVQSNPVAVTLTDIYTVPNGSRFAGAMTIINRDSAVPTNFRVSVALAGAADSNEQYLAYDEYLAPSQRKRIHVGPIPQTAVVRVYATLATLSFNLMGIEY